MSKTIEIRLYQFSELTESAQETAINNARQWVGDTQAEIDGDIFYWTKDEMRKVLGIWTDLDEHYSRWGWREDDECARWDDLSDDPKYLLRYINWVMGRISWERVGKEYSLPDEKWTRRHVCYPKRVSKISTKNCFEECLTDEWTDATFDKWMNDAYKWVRDHKTIDEFVDSLLRRFHKAWDENTEWGYSDDNVRDIINMNDDTEWYLEDGRKFDGTFAL